MDLITWERAEQHRSAIDASLHPDVRPLPEAIIQRYLTPPADTAYHLEYAFHLAGDVRGKTVLDFGCGRGENSAVLSRRGARVIGCDISPDLVQQAAKICPGAQWCVGSAHALPLADHSVDVVFGIMILHHLDIEQSAAEIARVLKPGGRAIFSEPVRTLKSLQVLRKCIPYTQHNVSPCERPLTNAEVDRICRHFTSAHVRAFSLPTTNVWTMLHWPAVETVYQFDRWLLDHCQWLTNVASVRVIEAIK